MEQTRFHGLRTVVQDMDLLHGGVTLVHIVELQHIEVEQQRAHSQRIGASIVLYFGEHHTTHGKIDRFLLTFGDDDGRLLEMA